MPRPMTEQEREAFLEERRIAVMSLPSDDERPPLSFPIWYGYQPKGQITYYTHRTEPKSRKQRLLNVGSVVTLCMQQEELPYRYVTVEGTVVDVNEAPTAEQQLAIVRRYLPEDQAQAYVRNEMGSGINLVLFTIRPDRWSSLDFSE